MAKIVAYLPRTSDDGKGKSLCRLAKADCPRKAHNKVNHWRKRLVDEARIAEGEKTPTNSTGS